MLAFREAYRGGFNFASHQALLAVARIFDQLPEVGQNKAEAAVQKIADRSRASLEATNKRLLEQDVIAGGDPGAAALRIEDADVQDWEISPY